MFDFTVVCGVNMIFMVCMVSRRVYNITCFSTLLYDCVALKFPPALVVLQGAAFKAFLRAHHHLLKIMIMIMAARANRRPSFGR